MKKFTQLEARMAPLLIDNIDTDQIIPARYLKTTKREGLGEGLFANWRDDKDFPLNNPSFNGAEILLAGDNFGCGSSREHAPWALLEGGFRCVISTRFADIFKNNSLKNGLLVIEVASELHETLRAVVTGDASSTLRVDLEAQTLTLPSGETHGFVTDPFARRCILDGVDPLGYLLEQVEHIEAFECTR